MNRHILSQSQSEVSNLAAKLWEEAGKPGGRDSEFWSKAERMLSQKKAAPVPAATPKPAPVAAPVSTPTAEYDPHPTPKVVDVSVPPPSKNPWTPTKFDDQNGDITLEDLQAVMKFFGGAYRLTQDENTFTISCDPMLVPHLKELLSHYWELKDETPEERKVIQPDSWKTKSFVVILPSNLPVETLEKFLRSNRAPSFITQPLGGKKFEFTTAEAGYKKLVELIKFYAEDHRKKTSEEPEKGSTTKTKEGPKPDVVKIPLKVINPQKFIKYLQARVPKPPAYSIDADNLILSTETPEELQQLQKVMHDYGLRRTGGLIPPRPRAASAFIHDIRIADLPKEVQKDIEHFVQDKKGHVIQYGMVVPELVKKVDPENYKTAKGHVADKSDKELEKEIYEKSKNKYILLVNDRIVDGHHFLAKADKLGVTRTLKVLDLTPLRFQKKKAAQSLAQQSN